LSRNPELARSAPPTDRQQHGVGCVLAAGRLHDEAATVACDVLDAFLVFDLEAGLALDAGPELEQRLLLRLAEVDLANERHRRGRGHHQLAARILIDGAAERLLLDRD